ncbi:hypothetical protein Tco_0238637 [Tanacetum coccineum]
MCFRSLTKIVSERKKVFREIKKCEKIRAKRSDFPARNEAKTCNNDKSLSEIQLEHEKEDEFVVVVVKGLYDGGEGDCKYTLGGSRGESFWEEGGDFRVGVLHFHTCLTDIRGFLEKLEWWFEQDIDDDEEEDEECEGVVRYENLMI